MDGSNQKPPHGSACIDAIRIEWGGGGKTLACVRCSARRQHKPLPANLDTFPAILEASSVAGCSRCDCREVPGSWGQILYQNSSRAQDKKQSKKQSKYAGGGCHRRSLLSQESLDGTRYFGGIVRGGLRYMPLWNKQSRETAVYACVRWPLGVRSEVLTHDARNCSLVTYSACFVV